MSPPTRLAVLGYGFIADMHVRAAHDAGADVIAIAGHHAERARTFAERHGIDPTAATDDWETTVTRDDVDAVVIGTPNS